MSPKKGVAIRPYAIEDRQKFAELIREHGARATRELCGRKVSACTLLRIAREFGIELKKGRRPRRAA